MSGETVITVVGNLTNDPELRFTATGAAVSNFTVASTPRTFDRQANEWKDGDTLFLRCSLWNTAAENVAESLTKGTRVIASGRLRSRSYQTREGEQRTSMELDVEEIGPSLRYATARPQRNERRGQDNGGARRNPVQANQAGGHGPVSGYAPPAAEANQDNWSQASAFSEEPPF